MNGLLVASLSLASRAAINGSERPARGEPERDVERDGEVVAAPSQPIAGEPLVALVVDSEMHSLAPLRRSLERSHVIVVARATAEEALRWLGEREGESTSPLQPAGRLALIVVEAMLPRMSGFAFCEVLRGRTSTARLPVLLVARHDDLDWHARALEVGADAFAPKSDARCVALCVDELLHHGCSVDDDTRNTLALID